MTARDFTAAERIMQDYQRATFVLTSEPEFPKEYFEGCTALAKGDGAAARIKFEATLLRLEAALAASPNDALRHALLGSVYAFLGRKEEAIHEGNRGVDLKPENKDAVLGPRLTLLSALIYAHTGETAKAVQLIQHLLVTPAAGSETGPAVTQTALRLQWAWDPLRRDPEFQKLLTGPEPKTIYK